MRRCVPIVIACVALAAATGCSGSRRWRATSPPATLATTTTTRPPRRPVILLYGTFAATDWTMIEDALAARGDPVFRFDYGNGGTGEITRSGQQLAAFVEEVRARTGAGRVSLIGHSQGAVVARYYVKFLDGRRDVDDLIALSPPNHGTTSPMAIPAALLGAACPACTEQVANSPFLTSLNDGDEAPPPVDYTIIQTRYDLVVTPYSSAFLQGPSGRVTNMTLQDRCPDDFVGHTGITSDPIALRAVEDALDHAGPADAERVTGGC